MTQSLYDQIGGKDAVDGAVDLFYDHVLKDERINHLFDGVDMARQRAHMKAFLTYAFGGAPNYEGKSMREAHKHLPLTEEHFDAVAENLHKTLLEMNVSEDLIGEIMTIAASTHDDVLNV